MSNPKVVGSIALVLAELGLYACSGGSEPGAKIDQAKVKAALWYLTEKPAIADKVVVTGTDAYLGFNHRPDDLTAIVNGAAAKFAGSRRADSAGAWHFGEHASCTSLPAITQEWCNARGEDPQILDDDGKYTRGVGIVTRGCT